MLYRSKIYTAVTRRSALFKFFAAIGMCSMILTGTALAQAPNALAGKWKMVSSTADGDIPWTLTISYADGKYSATVTRNGEGEGPVKNLKVDGTSIHFRVPYEDSEYDIDLKLEGDSLTGTWSGGDNSGATKGQRAEKTP